MRFSYHFLTPIFLTLLCNVLHYQVLVAAEAPPFSIATVGATFNVPQGVSYDPAAPLEVQLTLKNTGKVELDLERAQYRVRRTRAVLGDPSSIWDALYTDLDEVAAGPLVQQGQKKLAPETNITVSIRFLPRMYGHFSVLIRGDWDAGINLNSGDAGNNPGGFYRAVGLAVVHKPAEGFRPDSPFIAGLPWIDWATEKYPQIDLLGRYGIKWVRHNFEAPEVKPGEFDWTGCDVMANCLRRNSVLMQGELLTYSLGDNPRIGRALVTYGGGGKANFIPTPESFPSVASFVEQVTRRYADIMSVAMLRNEPWEGGSISNYGATAKYLRALYALCREAGRKGNPEFRLAGNDQITNFEDQFQIAGAQDLIDIVTHHAGFIDQRGAPQSAALGKPAWENEDWSSHNDSYVVASLVMKLAGGYAKSNPCQESYTMKAGALGVNRPGGFESAGPLGQVISTFLYFVEDTKHVRELGKESLPWIHLFAGKEGRHVATVTGRIKLYGYHYNGGHDKGDAAWTQVRGFGHLTVVDPDAALSVYDICGNEMARTKVGFSIPLTEDTYYVLSAKGADDVASKLIAATAWFDGGTVQVEVADLDRPLAQKPAIRVTVEGAIQAIQDVVVEVTPPTGWKLSAPRVALTGLKPGERRVLEFAVEQSAANGMNRYPLQVTTTGPGGSQTLADEVHVAVIAHATVTVDGDLSDWEKAKAVPITMTGGMVPPDPGELYWFPMKNLIGQDSTQLAARMAFCYDDAAMYVMAEVNDPKVEMRSSMQDGVWFGTHAAPLDYMYWWAPQFASTRGDGLKLAFDIKPVGAKDDPWLPVEFQKLIDTRFVKLSADYEYDAYAGARTRLKESYEVIKARHLERLAKPPSDSYKGEWAPFEQPELISEGEPISELWRLMAPGVPRHNYYPFSPRLERDQGLVPGGKTVVIRDGNTWRYEMAIPWSELAQVPHAPGSTVRFAPYVLDNGRRALSWTAGRSSCRGYQTLHPTWVSGEGIGTGWTFLP